MESLSEWCCGLDVQATTVVACRLQQDHKERRTFASMPAEVVRGAAWLRNAGCPHVASERPGVDWQPVCNMLAGLMEGSRVHARHGKAVPGHKTDARARAWLAALLRPGLRTARGLPPRHIRALRERVRSRASVLRAQSAVAHRSQQVIESGQSKLGQGARDALGVSGCAMLWGWAVGATAAPMMADWARQSVKRNKPAWGRARAGRLTASPGGVLGELRARYAARAAARARGAAPIRQAIEESPAPWVAEAVTLRDTMPGVGEHGAQTIGAEMGGERERFPRAEPLASWAGRCPGTQESAGQRTTGKPTKGSPLLRAALVQAAGAASPRRGPYRAAQSHRRGKRMGHKKALGAVAPRIVGRVDHMGSRRMRYGALGEDVCTQRRVRAPSRRLIRQREACGCKVTVEGGAEAA